MIAPNLIVRDMARSARFYRDILGMTLTMTVSPEREVGWPGEARGAAFAMLEWDGARLMLQTVESLAGEPAVFAPDHAPALSGTVHFGGPKIRPSRSDWSPSTPPEAMMSDWSNGTKYAGSSPDPPRRRPCCGRGSARSGCRDPDTRSRRGGGGHPAR